MRKVVRLQFASMPPKSVIRLHRDTGDYAKFAHRIHLPVILERDEVSFEVRVAVVVDGEFARPQTDGTRRCHGLIILPLCRCPALVSTGITEHVRP